MPSDEQDTCPQCKRAFTDADDEMCDACSWCGLVFHPGCLGRHGCPEQVRADKKALEAWNAGVRGW
jgi:hypothetical protein